MIIHFNANAWEDYLYWQATHKGMLQRINRLIKETSRTPYEGTGKPEPLKYDKSGYWSRRIDGEHRLVYKICDDTLVIIQCRYHY